MMDKLMMDAALLAWPVAESRSPSVSVPSVPSW